MCHPASIVMTKDRDFWSMKTDSHSEIIAEFKLCESIRNKSAATAESCLVKVELTPPTENAFGAPLKQWRFKIDQDIVPKWFDPKKHEARARQALKEWHKARVFTSGVHEVLEGSFFAVGTAHVTAYGSSQVTACDSSKVTAYGSSTVISWNSNPVSLSGNAVRIDRSGAKPKIRVAK